MEAQQQPLNSLLAGEVLQKKACMCVGFRAPCVPTAFAKMGLVSPIFQKTDRFKFENLGEFVKTTRAFYDEFW
jgi:hypothetical protein